MKSSIVFITAFFGMIITQPAQANSSQTKLAQVGSTVTKINALLKTAVGRQTEAAGLKLPSITTSYVLGQGLTINVAEIDFPKQYTAPTTNTDYHQQPLTIEAQKVAATKRAAHRKKARDLAHKAHHLREQSKSLKQSISEAQGKDKAKFNEHLKQVREQMKAVDVERRLHAKSETSTQNLAHSGVPKQQQKPDLQLHFYQQVEQAVAAALCKKSQLLKTIDQAEKISVVYQLGANGSKGYSVKGWMVDNARLSDCGDGITTVRELKNHVTEYQY